MYYRMRKKYMLVHFYPTLFTKNAFSYKMCYSEHIQENEVKDTTHIEKKGNLKYSILTLTFT